MIEVDSQLVDFMDGTPVNGAEVIVTIKVIPRFRSIEPFEPEPNEPLTVMQPRSDLAESVQKQGKSNAQGKFFCSFDVSSHFQRLKTKPIDGILPTDVVAVTTVNATYGNLSKTVSFGDIRQRFGQHILNQNSTVNALVAMDFAKAIVGHTTPNSTTLWFCLHDRLNSSDRYVCQISHPNGNLIQEIPVDFDANKAKTATLTVNNLQSQTLYRFSLIGHGRTLTKGEFKTAPLANANRISIAFGSCHLPNKTEKSLSRWKTLANQDDYDLMLLIGDQIYGDNIEKMNLGNTWFERYVNRYHQLWNYWPMRQVLRNTPVYMTGDDHEVVDDWGVITEAEANAQNIDLSPTRINDALKAYRIFQQSHNPGGYNGKFHHHFRWGPASIFMMDSRSQRNPKIENGTHPIFGQQQWEDIEAWSKSPETLAADIIFFAAPVPIAFLPVEEVRRVVQDIIDEGQDAGGGLGGIIGGAIGGVAGFFIGGPVGAIAGATAGSVVLGYIGGEAGEASARDRVEEKGLADLNTRDLEDMWTYSPNQRDMTRILNCLFNLANDTQESDPTKRKRRAVFLLGGDVHSGSMHLIRSFHSQSGNSLDHKLNPLIYQVTSSAISQDPVHDKTYEAVISHIQDGLDITECDLIAAKFDGEELVLETLPQKPANFTLDSEGARKYRAEIVDLVTERNFGQITIERVSQQERKYQVYLTVEGETKSLTQAIELNLDAKNPTTQQPIPIKPVSLFGQVLATKGKINLLRVHDVGTGYGPSNDYLNVEVVVKLDSEPTKAFGFQLRADTNEGTHKGMLDLLRDAFKRDKLIRLEYIRTGRNNGRIIRVHPDF